MRKLAGVEVIDMTGREAAEVAETVVPDAPKPLHNAK
jgi:hypothetical protein